MTTPRVAVALLAGLMFAAAASAAEVRGVVARIDPDKKELTLEERGLGVRGTVLVFTLPDQTPVLFGDQPAAPSDLQVGRRVRVEYTLDDGRQVVQMIHVLGGPKPPPPATATPPIAPISGDALTGVLRHVGYSDRELTVVGPGSKGAQTETTLAVPESARIVKNGKETTLDDLKEGDTATVQVEKKDGRPTATVVQVGVGAGPAAEKTTSKMVPKLRFLLKIADQLLQGMENNKDR